MNIIQPYAIITGSEITGVEFHDPATYSGSLLLLAGIDPMPWVGWTLSNGAWSAPPEPADIAHQQTLQQRAQNALNTNQTYLTLTSPTSAQAITQVQALTRQVNALIRLNLGLLDTISDS